MATITINRSSVSLVAVGTTQTNGAFTRGTYDMRTAIGGLITMKITNGATPPTVGCTCSVLVSHNSGSTPTAASSGAEWKTVYRFNGGAVANAITEQHFRIEGGMHVEVEFAYNTVQPVTVEALMTVDTNAVTV